MKHLGTVRRDPPHPSRGCILFVEDDPSILELQLLIMKRLGHRVMAATDGEEALQVMRREPPDVVVLDIMLPGCDGYAVLARMRADRTLRHIPVAFVSARREGSDFSRGFAAGGQLYLAKPFTARGLQTVVEALLHTRIAPSRPA